MAKVYITGISANSAIGCTIEEIFENISNGYKGTSNIENFNTERFPTTFSAEVKESGKVVKTAPEIDRKALFINNSMNQLVEKYDFLKRYPPENLMLNLGAGIDYFDMESYINSQDYLQDNWQNHCTRAVSEIKKISEKYNIKGGHYVNVSACVASTQAIGNAYRILRKNPDKAIITGGFDSMLSYLHYMGFYKLGALSTYQGKATDACRPFDKDRCGLVIGEGGITILLESEKNAKKEEILGEITGYSSTLDAFQVTDPEPNGVSLTKAIQNALKDAEIKHNEIDCVHMHGTGTVKNALAETNALKAVFGERHKSIPVYSMKGQIGHLIGACGAMEFTGVIYSLLKQKVPVTVNSETPDPNVPLNVIRDQELDLDIKYILKINAAFGGQNTALIIKKHE